GSVENLVSGMGPQLARSFSDPNLTRVNWSGLTNGLPEILRGMVSQVVGAVKTMNRTISGTTFAPGVAVSAPGVIRAPMIAAASAEGFDGARVPMVPDGIARLVNKSNNRWGRRCWTGLGTSDPSGSGGG